MSKLKYPQYYCLAWEPGCLARVTSRTRTHITFETMVAVFGYEKPERGTMRTLELKGSAFTRGDYVRRAWCEKRWKEWEDFLATGESVSLAEQLQAAYGSKQ